MRCYRDFEDARTWSGRRLVALIQRLCWFKGDGGRSDTVGGGGRVVDGSSTDGNVLLRLPFPLRGKLKSLLGRGRRLMAPAKQRFGDQDSRLLHLLFCPILVVIFILERSLCLRKCD